MGRLSDDFLTELIHWPEDQPLDEFARRDLELLIDELRELRAAQQWRKIESAPKDGTPILVMTANGKVHVAEWCDDEIQWWFIENGKRDMEPMRGAPPQGWMPLPKLSEVKQ